MTTNRLPRRLGYTPDEVEQAARRLHELAAGARERQVVVDGDEVLGVVGGMPPSASPSAAPEWVRSTAAATILGVSRNTVKKWARIGYLRGSRRDPEGWWRIPRSSVDEVARLEQEIAAEPDLGELPD